MFAKTILFFFIGAILYAQNIDSLTVEYKGCLLYTSDAADD